MTITRSGLDIGAIELVDQKWPVVIVRPLDQLTDQQLDNFLHHFRDVASSRGGDHSLVLDLRFYKDMPATQRRRISEEMEKGTVISRCHATAMVFTSPVLKLVLTAILWLNKPKHELKVFSDIDAAMTWASEKLSDGLQKIA
ncbi:MAG: hypothetical protein ABIJ09_14350 [Pseudomonadota bacterium]